MSYTMTTALEFTGKVTVICGVVLIFALLIMILWAGSEVLLLIFAGGLFGVFLRALADLLSRHLPVSRTWSVAIVFLTMLIGISLTTWAVAPSVQRQFEELSAQLPVVYENLKGELSHFPLGGRIVQQLPSPGQLILGRKPVNVFGQITGLFSSVLNVATGALIVLIIGIYFAFHPELYLEGLMKLVPRSYEQRAREVLKTIGITLRAFLTGISISMAINGTLTFLGLWALGIPFAIPLGILAGLFTFIPNIGPFISGVPAVLIGLSQGPTQGLYVLMLYLAVQNFDGFVISPLIQQKAIAVPPVILIASQLLLAVMFGFLGLLLAVPIVAVLFVLVKMVYVEDALGKRVEVKGELRAKDETRHVKEDHRDQRSSENPG